jgi:hypothetical protein
MANFKNITQSGVITSLPGTVNGFIVNTHSSGTLKLWDGLEAGVQATSTLTSTNPYVPAAHAINILTSIGASVAATHATGTLTSGGTNFLDAVKASLVLTNDGTNPTAGGTVTVDDRVFTFRAAAAMNDATDVLIAATAAETTANLCKAINQVATVTADLTTSLTITVTAKAAGTGGNSITVDENADHTSWAGGATALAGGLAAETVTIGAIVYTFKNVCTAAYDVEIGSTLTLSLRNLKNAINKEVPAVGYNVSTPAHTQVVAYSSDATTLVIYANVVGASLNALATTETCADAAWGGGTLVDGVATTASTVTIGANVYTQVDVLSETLGAPAVANQVLRGATEATFLTALKAAINGVAASEGTLFSTGTVKHPYIVATTLAADAVTVRARYVGDDAYTAIVNALATTETLGDNYAWTAITMGTGTGDSDPSVSAAAAQFAINGRTYTFVVELDETLSGDTAAAPPASQITAGAATSVDQIIAGANVTASIVAAKKAINASGIAGTDYSTGTLQNADVFAGAINATTMVITAYDAGTYGNAITTTENMANTAWTSTVMASGTGSRSTPILGTITFPAVTVGPLTYNFPEPLSFVRGLYATFGGTSADITFEYN